MSAHAFHEAPQWEMEGLCHEAALAFMRCFPLARARALRDLLGREIVASDPEQASREEIERVALQAKGWEKDRASLLSPRHEDGLAGENRTKLRLLVTLAKYIAAMERAEVRSRRHREH